MTSLDAILGQRVLLLDAAMGSQVQAMGLDVDSDFGGCENCTEILNRTRPDIIRGIHRASLEAGADAVETNSFGASPVTLAEFGLADEAYDLNLAAARIAREAAGTFSAGRPRFVFGAIGPGTRLPTLGQVSYADIADAIAVQCAGLIAGGVDALLIETVQDLLQAKAAIRGARRAMADAGRTLPLVAQATVESTGTLLVGADIAAAATVLHALDIHIMGINCATGPQEMAEHVSWLSQNWPGPISVLPNAGLPELVGGVTRYPLSAGELAEWMARFIVEDGVALVGGCCGTTAEHVAALDTMLRDRAEDGFRPRVPPRGAAWTASVASLYGQTPLRQETALLMIGERCNANGSRKFRRHQEAQEWEACVAIARDQAAEGSHCIDLCTALVGEDETQAMNELVGRIGQAVTTPLVIDSTEHNVIADALARYGGKAILNSINFEDGEAPAAARLALARQYGAAVVALTIDEDGMARTASEKLRIARRLADFACERGGLPAADLLIDPLTFTICTGNDEDRRLGIETLDAIALIAEALPECQIVLGLSNISFGLRPAARHVLNSVFLDHARASGMTAAIIHVGKIVPLHSIPDAEVRAAEDLIFDRRRSGFDPLHAFIALFEGRESAAAAPRERPAAVEDRLRLRIVDGDRDGLAADLDEAMREHPPINVINNFLLDGMKTVGELFGSGKMQLPFVLQSAETMKAAVSHLEPHMDRVEGDTRGIIVLATVKGDVHDIGKNLTDIILTNNGFRVVNLGIKQPVANILEAAEAHDADCIGMSGLLVKSTVIMRENLTEMARRGLRTPVLLGGAALTRRYVEEDCAAAYRSGTVAYARDAFDGLTLMDAVSRGSFDTVVAESRTRRRPASEKTSEPAPSAEPAAAPSAPALSAAVRARRAAWAAQTPVPRPPVWGAQTIDRLPLAGLRPWLNTHTLYQLHWGYKKQGRSYREFREWSRAELDPMLDALIERCAEQEILVPSAVFGLWPAISEGNDLVLLAPHDHASEVARFSLPRQNKGDELCIADFVRGADSGEVDAVGLQAVTVGARASQVEREYFAADRYRDYLYLHGLGVEMAEAMAEYTHKRIREDLGFGHEDDRDMERLIRHGYRGARYSFGFPACPNLEDQAQLLHLLDAAAIGLHLGEEAQLDPEQSTSALVIHHPEARYFTI